MRNLRNALGKAFTYGTTKNYIRLDAILDAETVQVTVYGRFATVKAQPQTMSAARFLEMAR